LMSRSLDALLDYRPLLYDFFNRLVCPYSIS
jgi:hypothetical protein